MTKINREAFAALKTFKRAKPWQGTFGERMAKFQALAEALGTAYGIPLVVQFHGEEEPGRTGNGVHINGIIHMRGKLSVVTLLYCIGLARGKSRTESIYWSQGVFERVFPKSFARCAANERGLLVASRPEVQPEPEQPPTE